MNAPSAPGDLEALQRVVHQLLRGELSPDDAATRLGAPRSRLAVYARFVRGHVTGSLEKNYPCLRRVLGPATWQALVDDHFREAPAQDYELNHAVAGFPAFLEARVARGEPGLHAGHVELAALEWLEFAVYVAPTAPAAAAAPGPRLNPTLEILETTYRVHDVLSEHHRSLEGDLPPLRPAEPSQTLLVLRDPRTLRVRTLVADDARLFAFKVAHDGLTVADAAHAAGLSTCAVEEILDRAALDGLVEGAPGGGGSGSRRGSSRGGGNGRESGG